MLEYRVPIDSHLFHQQSQFVLLCQNVHVRIWRPLALQFRQESGIFRLPASVLDQQVLCDLIEVPVAQKRQKAGLPNQLLPLAPTLIDVIEKMLPLVGSMPLLLPGLFQTLQAQQLRMGIVSRRHILPDQNYAKFICVQILLQIFVGVFRAMSGA